MTSKTLLPLVAIIALVASCGGSSSSTTADITPIDSLSDVPDTVVNPQAYDLTTQTASLSVLPNKTIGKVQQAGTFSRAGCEANELKKNVIRNAILPRMILCNVKAFETASGGAAAGDGVFNYWKMPERESGPQGMAFEPRVAIKQDGSAFTFAMCNGTTKAMELYINTANNAYSGHVIDVWGAGFQGSLQFSADGLPPDNFTSASFTQSFIEESEYYQGYGSATFQATPTYNVVYGFHSGREGGHGGTFAGATYGKFDLAEGTAKYRADSGFYPAQTVEASFNMCAAQGNCTGTVAEWLDPETGWLVSGNPCSLTGIDASTKLCFAKDSCPSVANGEGLCEVASNTHTESFTIDTTNPLALVFTRADTSAYAADVALATAPDSSTRPAIEFTNASADVDCSGSDSWPVVSFSSEPDMSACSAMEEEMNNWQAGDTCSNQEAQDAAKAGEIQ